MENSMTSLSGIEHRAPFTEDNLELRRLVPLGRESARRRSAPSGEDVQTEPLVFELNARFESGGTWAGVDQLAEAAYRGLLDLGQDAIVEEHQLELYMVVLDHRDRIKPKYLCLTDIAGPGERTRLYPLDRAYRLVHGLVGMTLQWKRAIGGGNRWLIVVRNFDRAQNLATRFFGELARRATAEDQIDIVVEIPRAWPDIASSLPEMQAVPAPWVVSQRLRPAEPAAISDDEARVLETQASQGSDILLERKYLTLLTYHRSSGDATAAARIALNLFIAYVTYGYYREAESLLGIILPHFDDLVGDDEVKCTFCVSMMDICLVMINEPERALSVVTQFAAHLTKPNLLAETHYILCMHYLRYAQAKDKDIERAEHHILQAVAHIAAGKDNLDPEEWAFKKVFIDNGLAFLRARQGRHQEALNLCKSGFEFLAQELEADRHLLHRSVLQYNIAQIYVMLGRLDDGLDYYRRTLSLDPNYSEYHNEAGNILQEQGRYREAIESYVRAIERSAPYPEVYFNKAVCHARQEELEDAIACFETSIELNPNQPESYALLADSLRELGRFDEALERYDAAIALGYDSIPVRVNRAAMRYNNGSYELALLDMNQVIARDANHAAHYENRAVIYQAMNQQALYLCDLDLASRYRDAA
jgi:tetratricopeptide (TPR) repeat protein